MAWQSCPFATISGQLRQPYPQWREAGRFACAAPTKLVIVINARAAKTLGLEIPARLMALAEEIIDKSIHTVDRDTPRQSRKRSGCRMLALLRHAGPH
jgi:hypothetical protein